MITALCAVYVRERGPEALGGIVRAIEATFDDSRGGAGAKGPLIMRNGLSAS